MYAISGGTLTAREGSTALSLCLPASTGQSIVALVTDGQTARKQAANCNLPPFTLPVAIHRPSGKQAAKSGWAARFSSEV